MEDKKALKNLARYLYYLMSTGVNPEDFSDRLNTDISKIQQDDTLMKLVILEEKIS